MKTRNIAFLLTMVIVLIVTACGKVTPVVEETEAVTPPKTQETTEETLWSTTIADIRESVTASGVKKPEGEVKVGALLITLANPYWVTVQEGWLDTAKELGIEVDIQTGPSEDDIAGQLNTCESMVAAGYDAIVVNTITEQNLVPCIIKGSKAGIPMIDPDGRIDIKAVEEGGGTLYQGSTLDYYEQGMLGAKYIIEQLGDKGGQVAIIEGMIGSPQGEARRDGAKDTFDAASNIEIVSIQAGDWDRLKALDATTNILQANPDLAGIYCANDVMALAAFEAIDAAGKAGQVIIVGTDFIEEAKEAIKDGRMAASVAFSPYMEGMISAYFALMAINNMDISSTHIISVLVSAENVAEMEDWK
jgi:D-allose transport system substrate-binding protein